MQFKSDYCVRNIHEDCENTRCECECHFPKEEREGSTPTEGTYKIVSKEEKSFKDMLKGHHELHQLGGCKCEFYSTTEGKAFVGQSEVPESWEKEFDKEFWLNSDASPFKNGYSYERLKSFIRSLRNSTIQEERMKKLPENSQAIEAIVRETRNNTLEEASEAVSKGQLPTT